MAGIRFTCQTQQFTTGTSELCVLQILAAANHRVKVREFSVSFTGIVNTDAPILCQLLRQSDAGSGGDALTPQKMDPTDDETIQTSALENLDGSAVPTETSELISEEVHPQGGYTWQAPFGGEIVVPGSGRLGINVTAAVAVNCVARMVCEE